MLAPTKIFGVHEECDCQQCGCPLLLGDSCYWDDSRDYFVCSRECGADAAHAHDLRNHHTYATAQGEWIQPPPPSQR